MRKRILSGVAAVVAGLMLAVLPGGVAQAKIEPVDISFSNPAGNQPGGQQPSCQNDTLTQESENQNPAGHAPGGHN
jgi:hypothetical protein